MKKLIKQLLLILFSLCLLFGCSGRDNSEIESDAMYVLSDSSEAATEDTFPIIEYDVQHPYTTVCSYWMDEILVKLGNYSRGSLSSMSLEMKKMLMLSMNYLEDIDEGGEEDVILEYIYDHMCDVINNYPEMNFGSSDANDIMVECEGYPYEVCKLEAMYWKEFGEPSTGFDESDDDSGGSGGNIQVSEFSLMEFARYSLHLLWNDAVVRYRYSESFCTSEHRSKLEGAMNVWKEASGNKLSFERVKNNFWNQSSWALGLNYHVFVDDKSGKNYAGQSTLGMVPWSIMYFNDELNDPRTYLHELGHTLGLMHEHQRPDRDDYIDVFMDDIPCGAKSQYRKCCSMTTFGSFDYESIMLYGSGLLHDGQEIVTMTTISGDELKWNYSLSDKDKLYIKELYKDK